MKNISQLTMLFDLDGTLINTLPDICGHINNVRSDYGLNKKNEDELKNYIGLGMSYLIKGAFFELDESEHENAMEKFRTYYYDCPHIGGFVYPGVKETLDVLKNWGCKIAVITNKPQKIAQKTLSFYLPDFSFDVVSGADSVKQKNPHPSHILETLNLMGSTIENSIFVGDHEVDKSCAINAGVKFYGALYGFGGVKAVNCNGLNKFSEILDKIKVL